jgi:hypothetical protein
VPKPWSADSFWGAYHFGVGGDGSDQAQFFLEVTKPDDHTLLVLDYEPHLTGPTMSLDQAREFVEHVGEATGRWPLHVTALFLDSTGNGGSKNDQSIRGLNWR